MAIYQYHCRVCNHRTDTQERGDHFTCSHCGAKAKRVFSFQYGRAALREPQFNHAVGQVVSSDREFREALKLRAAENTEKTGMLHTYEPVYPGDRPDPPFSGADQILDDRARILHDTAKKAGTI